jgi:hypothetical protein
MERIMKRPVAFLVGGLLVLLVQPLQAEEPPYLEFVRGLRAKGMADLALQYLQGLSQNPPAAIAPVLGLELAKTRLELAANETDFSRRVALQNQARAELENFVKNSVQDPLSADAALEIARISALQGRGQLTRSQRSEARDVPRAEALKARALFEDAGKQLQAATTQIGAQLTALANAATPQAAINMETLMQARLQAELEQGINLLDQARTYTEDNETAKRGEMLKRAIEALTKLSKRDAKNPLCWQALAWVGRCHQINDDAKAARAVYKDVLAEPGEHADAARRLARYFRLRALANDPDVKKPLAEIQKAAEEWLTLYPNYVNTPEGGGVRFELANAYLQQVTSLPKPQQQAPRAREVLQKAQKLFQSLEQSENEFTTQAHENKLNIILAIAQGRSKGDIAKLRDFEECYLRAQYEVALMSEEGKKLPPDQAEQKRKEHYKNIVESLNRAIDLADTKVSTSELNDARYLQAYAYLATGDYYRAVVTGEEMARTESQSVHAAMAGAYALRSYAMLIGAGEQGGAGREDLESLRGRLRSLALFVEQTWPSDAAADIARHMAALVLLSEKNYPEAVEVLERVTPGYSDATRAFYQLAGAALEAQKEEAKPRPGKPGYNERALAALLRIPELSGVADAATVHDYFNAKLMLADVYYRSKQYEKMDQLADALLKRIDGLGDKSKAAYRTSVLALTLYAKLGRAEADYAAGQYAKARERLDPIVKQVEDPALAGQWSQLKEKHPQIVRLLLGLALRSNVQDNKIERGKELLELLQKTFPENAAEILVGFVQQLREQIEQLRRQGNDAQAQFEKTVASFSLFLDELAKQQGKDPRPELLLFLAQSYSSLDKHARAAELAGLVAEPKPPEGKSEVEPKQMASYRAARLLHARELRLDREFAAADKALKAIQSQPWGQASIEAKKERILVLEDQEIYAGKDGAIPAWNSLMRQMKNKLQDNKVKEQYFDCYYHFTVCIYKNALKMSNRQAKDKSIQSAANYIFRLGAQPDAAAEPCKKRFEELLQAEPVLKEKVEELKKDSK